MRSFKKKISSLYKSGLDPLMQGIHNFRVVNIEVERLAEARKDECIGCVFFINEPISFLAVEDKRIPELSNKFCDECGCTSSYKLRQSIKKCDKWAE